MRFGSRLRWTAGIVGAVAAIALAAPPAANAEPAINAGNYTCAWTINLGKLDSHYHTRIVKVPVRCNGTMSTIAINIWGVNRRGFVNWTNSKYCSAISHCGDEPLAGWGSDEFDAWIKACLTVITPKGATASECQSKIAS